MRLRNVVTILAIGCVSRPISRYSQIRCPFPLPTTTTPSATVPAELSLFNQINTADLHQDMSPSAILVEQQDAPIISDITNGGVKNLPSTRAPLINSGSLDVYESFDVTNIIGKEFPNLQLSEIVHDDDKIRDLAILGKPFFIYLIPLLIEPSLAARCRIFSQSEPKDRRPEDPGPKTERAHGQAKDLEVASPPALQLKTRPQG